MVVLLVHQRADGDFGKIFIEEAIAKEAFEDVDIKSNQRMSKF